MNNSQSTPIVIPMEDEIILNPPYYFCSKPDCICHDDAELTAELRRRVDAGELTPAQALDAYWNQQERQA